MFHQMKVIAEASVFVDAICRVIMVVDEAMNIDGIFLDNILHGFDFAFEAVDTAVVFLKNFIGFAEFQ